MKKVDYELGLKSLNLAKFKNQSTTGFEGGQGLNRMKRIPKLQTNINILSIGLHSQGELSIRSCLQEGGGELGTPKLGNMYRGGRPFHREMHQVTHAKPLIG